LLGVAASVLQYGGSDDEAIAALLHDAVEDQGGLAIRAEIERRFGPAVAAMVDGCTDSYTDPKSDWRLRKEAYFAHLPRASPPVRLVSAADKLDNARAIFSGYRALGDGLRSRFRGGRDATLWYDRTLVDGFRASGGGPLVEEPDRVVWEIERMTGAAAGGRDSGPSGRR
jgi:hypothetical protein